MRPILFLYFFASLINACNEEKTDDAYLEEHYREIFVEYSDFMGDSHSLSFAEMDSILENKTGGTFVLYEGGEISAPNDNSFKLFSLKAESCDSDCSIEWFTFVHFYHNGNLIIKRTELSNIIDIHKLSDGKYLILDDYPMNDSFYICKSAQLISFEDDALIRHPTYYKEDNYLTFCQENSFETPFITYNDSLEELHYQYVDEYEIKSGYFSYKNGVFNLQKENIKEITPKSFENFLTFFEPIELPFTINKTITHEGEPFLDEDTVSLKSILSIENIAKGVSYGSYSGLYSFEHNDNIVVVVKRYYTPGAFGIHENFIELYTLSKEGKLLNKKELGCFRFDSNMGNNDYYETSLEIILNVNEITIYAEEIHATLIKKDNKESFEDITGHDTTVIKY